MREREMDRGGRERGKANGDLGRVQVRGVLLLSVFCPFMSAFIYRRLYVE
jgi:hypothetical protein